MLLRAPPRTHLRQAPCHWARCLPRRFAVAAASQQESYPLDDARSVTALVRQREEARRRHDWVASDRLRDKLVAVYGASVDDGGKGREQGKAATYVVRRGPLGGQTWRAYARGKQVLVQHSPARKQVVKAATGHTQSSHYRGVSWQRSKGQWRARIKLGGKNPVRIGLFDSEVEAARAYDHAARLAGRSYDANFETEAIAEAAAAAEAAADSVLDSSSYVCREGRAAGGGGSGGGERGAEPVRWMLLGAPGAGKGTYAKALAAAFGGVPIVGMGDMLREIIASGSEDGKRLAAYSDEGRLAPVRLRLRMRMRLRLHLLYASTSMANTTHVCCVAVMRTLAGQDEDVLQLLHARLSRSDVVERGFILDGFPRTVSQAEALKESAGVPPLQLVIVRPHAFASNPKPCRCDICVAQPTVPSAQCCVSCCCSLLSCRRFIFSRRTSWCRMSTWSQSYSDAAAATTAARATTSQLCTMITTASTCRPSSLPPLRL